MRRRSYPWRRRPRTVRGSSPGGARPPRPRVWAPARRSTAGPIRPSEEAPLMAKYGYTLMCELHGPKELVAQAQAAEAAGFDFLVISDHFHPWLGSHDHSPFAWSVLGAVAERTSRIELATMVTCPFVRYHPAIVAQAAATIGVMSDGR